jgi:hypothetical protein
MNESENQFSFTRAASSTSGRAKKQILISDGKHIAFTAKKGNKVVIVVDGQERGEYSSVPAGPVFRSDGVLEFLAADEPSLYRIEVRDF